MFDKIKFLFALTLVIAGITAYYMVEEQVPSVFYRVLGLLVVMGVAIGIAVTTELGGQAVAFSRAAAMEMRKTVWPTRSETLQTSLIVVVGVAILGFIIFLIDSVLKWAVTSLI